jgi:sugar phosphate isomerase/epimerase
LGFHVCDWLYVTKDLLLDRGMMGDGVIDIARIHGWVAEAGYDGLIEVEVFSAENWWRKEPADVLQTVVQRFVDIV